MGLMIPVVVAAISSSGAVAQQYAPLIEPLKIEQVPDHPIYYTVGDPGIPGRTDHLG